jgi:hypothetical protein
VKARFVPTADGDGIERSVEISVLIHGMRK